MGVASSSNSDPLDLFCGWSHCCGMSKRPRPSMEPLRVLEFFSGIGGMHQGLKIAFRDPQASHAFGVDCKVLL